MQREKKLRGIRQTLGEEEFTKGDEAVFFCPKCKHRKPKLSVNLVTDHFHCWICDFSGKHLTRLFRKGSQEREEYLKEIGESWNAPTPEKQYDLPQLPAEFKPLSVPSRSLYYRAAMDYLTQRGVCFEDILLWKIGYCEEGDYKNRVVIPSFDEFGELNFFVGRSFYENQVKYKHGNFDKDVIFNDLLIDWTRPIVVTEGPFDAIQAGENAIPLQGSILNESLKLFQKIVFSGVDVYFALDSDIFKKQLKIIELFLSYGVNSYYVSLNGKKDVGLMTKEEFQKAKASAQHIRSDLDLLKMRICA